MPAGSDGRVALLKVMPVRARVGSGVELAATVNELACPRVKVVLAALVNAKPATKFSVNCCCTVPATLLALKVTG